MGPARLGALLALAILPAATLASASSVSAEPPTSGTERAPGADPNEERAPEFKLKAAFLFQFIRYTSWPDSAFENERQPIELVIVGKDPFGKLLEATFGKKRLHGRAVIITRLAKVPATVRGHMLIASGLSPADEDQLVRICKGKPVLLFGDKDGYAERGGCGNFFLDRNKVRFAINTASVKAAGLSMSSELLKLARIVDKRGSQR